MPKTRPAMRLRHTTALIELLSTLSDPVLADLGLTETEIESLDEVFDMACQHYEEIVGLPHPLEADGGQITSDMPTIFVLQPGASRQ